MSASLRRQAPGSTRVIERAWIRTVLIQRLFHACQVLDITTPGRHPGIGCIVSAGGADHGTIIEPADRAAWPMRDVRLESSLSTRSRR
jgi:hypothetical protein